MMRSAIVGVYFRSTISRNSVKTIPFMWCCLIRLYAGKARDKGTIARATGMIRIYDYSHRRARGIRKRALRRRLEAGRQSAYYTLDRQSFSRPRVAGISTAADDADQMDKPERTLGLLHPPQRRGPSGAVRGQAARAVRGRVGAFRSEAAAD